MYTMTARVTFQPGIDNDELLGFDKKSQYTNTIGRLLWHRIVGWSVFVMRFTIEKQ